MSGPLVYIFASSHPHQDVQPVGYRWEGGGLHGVLEALGLELLGASGRGSGGILGGGPA